MNHRKGYATAEDARTSKAYLQTPGATIEHCRCDLFHVNKPQPKPAPLKARRDTGPDAKTRRMVYARDGHACVCCGTPIIGRPHSVGHRKRRSQGLDNSFPNLLTFLGLGINPFDPDDHHARIDSRRDPEDEAKGYSLRSWQDPAEVSVMVFSRHGSGVTLWLLPDETRTTEAPAGVAA